MLKVILFDFFVHIHVYFFYLVPRLQHWDAFVKSIKMGLFTTPSTSNAEGLLKKSKDGYGKRSIGKASCLAGREGIHERMSNVRPNTITPHMGLFTTPSKQSQLLSIGLDHHFGIAGDHQVFHGPGRGAVAVDHGQDLGFYAVPVTRFFGVKKDQRHSLHDG